MAERFDLELVSASDEADLALLCCDISGEADYLPLADGPLGPGEAVLVIGFSLGIRALMARTDPEFVEGLRVSGITFLLGGHGAQNPSRACHAAGE